jgi:hypothetical protein
VEAGTGVRKERGLGFAFAPNPGSPPLFARDGVSIWSTGLSQMIVGSSIAFATSIAG